MIDMNTDITRSYSFNRSHDLILLTENSLSLEKGPKTATVFQKFRQKFQNFFNISKLRNLEYCTVVQLIKNVSFDANMVQ